MNGLLFIKWLSKPGKGNIAIHSCTTDSQGQELFVFLHSWKKEKKIIVEDIRFYTSLLWLHYLPYFASYMRLPKVREFVITVWFAGIDAWGNEAASQLLTISPDIEPLPLESNRPRPTPYWAVLPTIEQSSGTTIELTKPSIGQRYRIDVDQIRHCIELT